MGFIESLTMATAILPGKFECSDVVIWLYKFDACAEANGWNSDAKIKKLPAFLRGQHSKGTEGGDVIASKQRSLLH